MSTNMNENGNGVDALTSLKQLCEAGFGGDLFMAALALGREEDQVRDMLDGKAEIDEDLEMKIHGIAQERNLPVA